MKHLRWILPVLLALLLFTARAVAEEAMKEWTVLIYLCGSDLESNHGYASQDIQEIWECRAPISIADEYVNESAAIQTQSDVNLLIETGGSRKWHTEELDFDIDPGSLQRWRYDYVNQSFLSEGSFPLQNMAEPETLSDFIRWGAQTCPAKKYALVLWDHGGGAKTGLFIDELFDNDTMYLDEIGDALRDSGVHLEAVLFDACMMANLETAYQIRDSAEWMIASEEMVPGEGTNLKGWLQELLNNPKMDGRELGRCVCDMTEIKYANIGDRQYEALMTWSVVNLSKIERVATAFDGFMASLGEAYAHNPDMMVSYANYLYQAELYDNGREGMRDIGSVFYVPNTHVVTDVAVRGEVLDALSEAVVYVVRGIGRSESRGLSFCYAVGFDTKAMEVYSRSCPSPHYLAFLDAVSDWNAPEWLYEKVERLPDLDTLNDYRITIEKVIRDNGMPACFVTWEKAAFISDVNYCLYQRNEAGRIINLGRNVCRQIVLPDGPLWSAIDPGHWAAVEGITCSIDIVAASATHCLYNIPVIIDSVNWNLRCGRRYSRYLSEDYTNEDSDSTYTIYGLWEGYEDNTEVPNRNILPLSEMAGQEFRLLYTVDSISKSGRKTNASSESLTMYRALKVEEQALPPGTYYLDYDIIDIFQRSYELERIELYWDGTQFIYPSDIAWEGMVTINE